MASHQSRRSLWPYAIGGYFVLAITGIAIFVTWAVSQNMDLVRSDYYEHEILFQRHIDAVNRTRPLGDQVAITFNADARAILARIPAAHVATQLSGRVHLYRPSDAKLDRHVELKPGADGEQSIDAAQLASGLWKVRVEWTTNREEYVFERSLIID
jgi:nitrogen fixation protein FixH